MPVRSVRFMKTTTAEPFELFTTPVRGGSSGGSAGSAAPRLTAGSVDVVDLVEPDVLGRDAGAALAFVVARRRHQDLEAAEVPQHLRRHGLRAPGTG